MKTYTFHIIEVRVNSAKNGGGYCAKLKGKAWFRIGQTVEEAVINFLGSDPAYFSLMKRQFNLDYVFQTPVMELAGFMKYMLARGHKLKIVFIPEIMG